MSVQLDYTVNDTANRQVNPLMLYVELRALVLAGSVVEAMRTIGDLTLPGSSVLVYVDVAPSAPDKALIDGAVSAHTGAASAPKGDLITCADGTVLEATSFAGGVITWTEINA